ncbi:NAD(P)-dependent alcohol dehydrogenase [Paenibacillus gorillae]|uniref:NAD(P)-dependent alcohol dehydrogenase n=1 Tax=Paenibacillus gorillae TaxID=1243662 RepID=UPI0004AD1ACC|nr:NAD(P)-dependent alcohol dehydrogenase [Paenibacillus gorillae]
MKAAICTRYGPPDVVQIQEIGMPSVQDNEVLIKLHATTVTPGDCVIRSSKMLLMRLFFGILKPRKQILGSELSGIIEEVGSNVTKFQKGDEVFAYRGMKLGAHAAYITLPEHGVLTIKPARLTHQEAAAIAFGGTTALHFLRKGNVQAGMHILINGASGSVGSSAVQLAKHFGAEVTAVCGSSNVDWVKKLGADHVIDYTKEDFMKSGKRYDLIFDAVGKSSNPAGKAALTANGKFISVKGGIARENLEDLLFLKQLVEDRAFQPVIDRSFPFEQIASAHAYVEQGHKKGNVVITFN